MFLSKHNSTRAEEKKEAIWENPRKEPTENNYPSSMAG
jgi:hypothetical protein